MGFLSWLGAAKATPSVELVPAPKPRRSVIPNSGGAFAAGSRAYLAAANDRLVADMPTWSRSANADIRAALVPMRSRARHLAHNNDYAKGYLRTLRRNIVGPNGLQLRGIIRNPDGKMDTFANAIVERAFALWSKPQNCTVSGRLSFKQVQDLVITLRARDGEVLVHQIRGAANPFAYALQLIPIDMLDETLNIPFGAAGGAVNKIAESEIRMGVERDRGGKPIAYHLRTAHPFDDLYSYRLGPQQYSRLAAADVLHLFQDSDADQARGVTELHTSVRRLALLGGYEEAELTAARTAAAKMGFYSSETGDDAEGVADEQDPATDEFIQDADPGHFQVLPRGYKFEGFDPQHPTNAFPDFVRQMLRGAGAGAGVSYAAFANDLSQASYSSTRVGSLDDRDEWKGQQNWLATAFAEPVASTWLDFAMLAGQLDPLRPDRAEKYKSFLWQGRGFAWVDPEKEVNADNTAIGMRIKSRTEVCAERGREFEDVLREQKEERELAAKYGITLTDPTPPGAAKPPAQPTDSGGGQ